MSKFKFVLPAALAAAGIIAANVSPALANSSSVIVTPGNSLYKIAKSHGMPVSALEASNPQVSPENLQVGSTVRLPMTHTVQLHDTLYKLAVQNHLSVSAVEAANKNVEPSNLEVGSTVYLPPAQVTPSTRVKSAAVSPATSSDLYWLSHVIYAEAGAESLKTQIAVGDVVLHRMQSPTYPHSVHGVVFQNIDGHYQFTSVANGYIYTEPSSQAEQAAADVLEKHVEEVRGAMVFYNPAQSPNGSWVWNQPVLSRLGNFIFAK